MWKNTLKRFCGIFSRRASYFQILFIYAWLSLLPNTDSFFSVYCVFAVAGLCCLLNNCRRGTAFSGSIFWGSFFLSVLFSMSVILGNYRLFEPFTALMSLFNMGLCFAGGCVIGVNILLYAMDHLPLPGENDSRDHEKLVFFLIFGSVVVVDLVYLVFSNYPAVINFDTMAQLGQIMGDLPYSTWTPYWHTKTIELFYKPAYFLFGDVNTALFCVETAQILFIAVCFAYALVTLYQLRLPKLFLGVACFLYILYPYNIVFNVTIGKDVSFGVGLLLLMTALLRILTNTGKKPWLNYLMLIIGSFGFSLWRTNGMHIYLITVVILFFKFRTSKKLLLTVMVCVLLVCVFLNGPYLDQKDFEPIPFTETLAVPFQQLGRVIVNDRALSQEDTAFLSELFRMDKVKESYRPDSVDPMKFDVFRHENEGFLKENFGTFLKVWVRIGFENPQDYLLAWADETRGYWNGGYHMGVYDQGIPDNEMGMFNSGGDNLIATAFAAYFRYIEDPVIMEPLKSIGFIVWIVLACWWINVMKKSENSLLMIPVLLLLVGLWIGTPVFAEFRYAYPVCLVSPMILSITAFDLKVS